EIVSASLAAEGLDPLPGFAPDQDDDGGPAGDRDAAAALTLLTGAAHHFVSSSLAGQPGLRAGEGTPCVEIHPADAEERGIRAGDPVVVENGRGSCRLRAVVTDGVRRGVVVSPKGHWAKHNGGRNVNW